MKLGGHEINHFINIIITVTVDQQHPYRLSNGRDLTYIFEDWEGGGIRPAAKATGNRVMNSSPESNFISYMKHMESGWVRQWLDAELARFCQNYIDVGCPAFEHLLLLLSQ